MFRECLRNLKVCFKILLDKKLSIRWQKAWSKLCATAQKWQKLLLKLKSHYKMPLCFSSNHNEMCSKHSHSFISAVFKFVGMHYTPPTMNQWINQVLAGPDTCDTCPARWPFLLISSSANSALAANVMMLWVEGI